MIQRIVVGGLLGLLLVGLGAVIDRSQPLSQPLLFASLQIASVGGAGLGLLWVWRSARLERRRGAFLVATLLAWRVAYFPIMVFSGHVASIGEWVLAGIGLPIVVYPFFLLSVAALHGAAAVAACWIVEPPLAVLRFVLVPAFLVALSVSFLKPSDLTPLPDTVTRLRAPVPALKAEEGNPYLPALVGPGYWPNQRVVLLAAGLTYETIPPSPWATTVKVVLEGLFEEHPYGSSADRVHEHYRAYHAAHGRIGCRRLSDCPLPAGPGAAPSAP